MAPLIALVATSLAARGIGALGVAYLDAWPSAIAVGLAAMLTMTALSHWIQPKRAGLIAIVPSWVPAPALVVTVTGALELAGAIGLLMPPTRPAAAVCLAILLVAMFPANVWAAQGVDHPAAPRTPLPARTALQILFLGATLYVALQS